MANFNGLPVYKITVNEDLNDETGIDFISLVDYPAIETNWVAMGKQALKFNADADKQILLGPILIPDQPIYRYSAQMGEYYVVFTAEEIQKLVRKFQATQKTINVNYQHQDDSKVQDSVIQEIWLSGDNDKSKDYGFDLPKGTAFVCAFIGNKDFWEKEIKSNTVRGFSIEGFLDMELRKLEMNIDKKKFAVYKQKDGVGGDVYIDGEIAIDNYVFSNYPCVKLVNGQKVVEQYPCWENSIVLEDGTILTLKDSKIIKIDKQQTMSKEKLSTAKTDAGIEIHTDAESLAVGVDVYTMEPDGSKKPLPDSEYKLENGTTLKVASGKITEMVEAEEEMTEAETALLKKAFQPFLDAIEQKYEKRFAEMEVKLKNIPGAVSKTDLDEDAGEQSPTALSVKKALLSKVTKMREASEKFTKHNSENK